MARSTNGVIESVSVAELLPGLGSLTPPGGLTVAVFESVPKAAADTVPESVKTTLAPAGRLTDALMLPLPDAGHVPPPAPTHVQTGERIAAGTMSVTVAPAASPGPALLATIV